MEGPQPGRGVFHKGTLQCLLLIQSEGKGVKQVHENQTGMKNTMITKRQEKIVPCESVDFGGDGGGGRGHGGLEVVLFCSVEDVVGFFVWWWGV